MLAHIGCDKVVGDWRYEVERGLANLPFDAAVTRHAAAAVRRHRHLGRLPGRLRGEQLRNVCLGAGRLAGIEQRCRLPANQGRGLGVHVGAGDRELHRLVRTDRLREDHPFSGVRRRLLDEPAGIANALRSDQDPLGVQAVEDFPEAVTFLTKQRLLGKSQISDEECIGLVIDHGLDGPNRDRIARGVEVDQEEAHAVGVSLDILETRCSRQQQHQIRMLHSGGEDFLTVDHVPIGIPFGEGRDAGGVASGLGLGHCHRLEPDAAGRDVRKVVALLRLIAMPEERAHRVHLRVAGGAVFPAGIDLLEHDAGFDQAEPGAAVLGRNQDGKPAAFGERPHEFLRVLPFGIQLAPVRLAELHADLSHAVTVLLLLGGQREVHQSEACSRIARARRMIASSTISPSLAYAPRPSAVARSADAAMPRAQAISSSVGEKTWFTVSTCDGWMSNMPPKPSARPRWAAARKPLRSVILIQGESSGGRSSATLELRTTAARAAASTGLELSGSIPVSAARSKRPSARHKTPPNRAISAAFSTPAALSMMGISGRAEGPFAAAMAARQAARSAAPPALGSITPSALSNATAVRSSAI